MNTKDSKPQVKTTSSNVKNPVQQMRPNDNCDTIMKPVSNEEVKEAVKEINPDKNSMDSRG